MTGTARRGWLIALGVVVVLVGVIVGPRLVSNLTKKTAPPQLATASFRSFPVVATATGSLVPSQQVALNFSVVGQLTQVSVASGDKVTAGEVIARISDVAEQADLQAAEASLQLARAALANAQSTNGSHTPDPSQIQVAQAQIASAQAQVARAQAAVAATILISPTAGTVLAVNAQVGELVGPGLSSSVTAPGTTDTSGTKSFITIGDATNLEASANFAEADAAKLVAGQTGSFTVDAVPGLTVPCHLIALATSSSIVGGVVEYQGTLGLDSTDGRLRNGMTINASVTVARADNVLAVPNQALYLQDGTLHVDVWFQNRAVSTQVVAGLVGSELTQITSGLSSGQQIVLSAPNGLPSPSAG